MRFRCENELFFLSLSLNCCLLLLLFNFVPLLFMEEYLQRKYAAIRVVHVCSLVYKRNLNCLRCVFVETILQKNSALFFLIYPLFLSHFFCSCIYSYLKFYFLARLMATKNRHCILSVLQNTARVLHFI